jgi:hypothetical protein
VPEDEKEQTLPRRLSLLQVGCDTSTDFVVEPFSLTITFVDPNIAERWVGENNTQLLSRLQTADDESQLLIVTSIIDTTIVAIMHVEIGSVQDRSRNIRQLSGCLEESNGDGGPCACHVTPIFNTNTATR